jgi:hypothetical protein
MSLNVPPWLKQTERRPKRIGCLSIALGFGLTEPKSLSRSHTVCREKPVNVNACGAVINMPYTRSMSRHAVAGVVTACERRHGDLSISPGFEKEYVANV